MGSRNVGTVLCVEVPRWVAAAVSVTSMFWTGTEMPRDFGRTWRNGVAVGTIGADTVSNIPSDVDVSIELAAGGSAIDVTFRVDSSSTTLVIERVEPAVGDASLAD